MKSPSEMPTKPVVGMGATELVGSDCYPYTITEVLTEKTIVVQQDNWVHISGYFQHNNAKFEYESNPTGKTYKLRWSARRGCWFVLGHGSRGTHFSIGGRRYYQNPSY